MELPFTSMKVPERKSAVRILAFSSYGVVMSLYSVAASIGNLQYVVVHRLDVGVLAIVDSAITALDLLLTFPAGVLVDSVDSRYGKRRPILVVGAFLYPIVTYLFLSPQFLTAHPGVGPSLASRSLLDDDIVLEHCSLNATSTSGRYLHADSKEPGTLTLLIWYAFFKQLLYSLCNNLTHLPLNVLAYEAFPSPDEQATLFASSAVLRQLFGFLSQSMMIYIASVLGPDLHAQACTLVVLAMPLHLASTTALCALITEGSACSTSSKHDKRSFLASIRSAMQNSLFRELVRFRIASYLAHVFPSTMLTYFVTNVLKIENISKFLASYGIVVQVSMLASIRVAHNAIAKIGTRANLSIAYIVSSLKLLVLCIVPIDMFREHNLIYIYAVISSLLEACMHVGSEVLLGEVIAYDALLASTYRPMLYSTLTANITQGVMIFVSSIPSLVLSSSGYRNNGGCKCGCGAPCSVPHMRWDCPHDFAFSCMPGLESTNPVFPGAPFRSPCCTYQTPRVIFCIWAMFLPVPAVFSILSFLAAQSLSLSKAISARLRSLVHHRMTGSKVIDPITNTVLRRVSSRNNAGYLDFLHNFSLNESEILLRDSFRNIIIRFCCHLAFHVAVLGGIWLTFTQFPASRLLMLGCEAAVLLTIASAAITLLKLRAVIQGSKSLMYLKNHTTFKENMKLSDTTALRRSRRQSMS